MAPCRLTRPNVGRSALTPQRVAGDTMDPNVSLPMLKPTSPAAVIACPASVPHVTLCESAEGELGDQHRAGLVEAVHDCGVVVQLLTLVRFGAPGSAVFPHRQQILPAPWNTVQGTAVIAPGDFSIRLPGLPQGALFGQRDHALQGRAVPFEARQIHACQFGRRNLFRADQLAQDRDRLERQLLQVDGSGHPDRPGVTKFSLHRG